MSESEPSEVNILGFCSDLGKPVPLKAINACIEVLGYVAEVTATLTYYNEEELPINAVFTFPVDDSSAVYMFEADIDGRHIVAKIQAKEQAELTYQDAIDRGKTAILLKEDNSAGDTFCCKLGNLPCKSEALLTLKYVIELPQEPDGRLRFTLPTILNPRYSPDVGGEVTAEGAAYVPPAKVPYEFSMTAVVQGYFRVKSVTAEGLLIRVDLLDNQKIAEVSLDEAFKFDNDLSFLIEYETSFEPQVILEPGNREADGLLKEDILMVSFHPDLKEVAMASSGEFIFLIDRSGSMMGEKINDARDALLLFLKSLPPNSCFNVVSFGSNFKCLFSSGSKPYDEKSLKKALDLCEKMKADMGGTEILKPLQQIFRQKLIQGHPKYVFVLTDGAVSNTNEVTALVKKQSMVTGTRVFSVGIGSGASTALVKGIATNGNGKAEFITSGTRVQSKVVSLLKCAMQPAVTEVDIKWDLPPDVLSTMIPEPPNIITAGHRLTLFVVLEGVDIYTVYAPSTVTVTGKQNDREISFSMNFTLSEEEESTSSAPVHRLATKTYIQLLQTQESVMVNLDEYPYGNPEEVQSLRNKIIDLSCHSNVISKFTAFVAVDEDGKMVDTESVERPCPIPTVSRNFIEGITRSSMICCGLMDDGLEVNYENSYASFSASKPKKKSRKLMSFSGLFSRKAKSAKAKKIVSSSPATPDAEEFCDLDSTNNEVESSLLKEGVSDGDTNSPTSERVAYSGSGDKMLAVISLQQINGQWLLSDALLNVLEITKEDIEKLKFSKDSSVVCTVVVVSWLQHRFQSRQEEWQMIEAKALAWLSSNDATVLVKENIKLAADTLWLK